MHKDKAGWLCRGFRLEVVLRASFGAALQRSAFRCRPAPYILFLQWRICAEALVEIGTNLLYAFIPHVLNDNFLRHTKLAQVVKMLNIARFHWCA